MPENLEAASAAKTIETLESANCRLFRRSEIHHLEHPIPWLWHGYLARGAITLLTGPLKVGKTTLLAMLLGRMGSGGALAGQPVTPGRTIVLANEGASLWVKRMFKHDIDESVSFAFYPFVHKPSQQQWCGLIDDLKHLHQFDPMAFVAIDPIAAVLPGYQENNSVMMADALQPLRDLASLGVSILLIHYPAKGPQRDEQNARGSSVLPAIVHTQMELRWSGRASQENRRRQILAWSRFDETPRRVVVELNAAGTAYAVVPDDAVAADEITATLLAMIAANPGLTTRELHDAWRPTEERPRLRLLSEQLQALAAFGKVTRTGAGHRFEPWRWGIVNPLPPLFAGEGGKQHRI